jgi:hypothetical protein
MVTMQRTRNDIDHERAVNLGCLQLHTSYFNRLELTGFDIKKQSNGALS